MPGTRKSEMEKAEEEVEVISGCPGVAMTTLDFVVVLLGIVVVVVLLLLLHPLRKAKLPWGSDELSISVILRKENKQYAHRFRKGNTERNNKQVCRLRERREWEKISQHGHFGHKASNKRRDGGVSESGKSGRKPRVVRTVVERRRVWRDRGAVRKVSWLLG